MKVVAKWVVKQEGKPDEEKKRELEVKPVVLKSVQEAIAKHGEKEVLKAVNNAVVNASRAKATAALIKGKEENEIHKLVAELKLKSREAASPIAKLLASFNKLSKEEKEALLAEVKK